MKNNSHNLIHQLARHLDFTWERHQFYKKDADEVGCSRCKALWDELYKDHERHRPEVERGAGESL